MAIELDQAEGYAIAQGIIVRNPDTPGVPTSFTHHTAGYVQELQLLPILQQYDPTIFNYIAKNFDSASSSYNPTLASAYRSSNSALSFLDKYKWFLVIGLSAVAVIYVMKR